MGSVLVRIASKKSIAMDGDTEEDRPGIPQTAVVRMTFGNTVTNCESAIDVPRNKRR